MMKENIRYDKGKHEISTSTFVGERVKSLEIRRRNRECKLSEFRKKKGDLIWKLSI